MSPDGFVTQADTSIPLALVQPTSQADLVKVGNNLFRALAPVAPVAPDLRNVQGGYLELSTVNPTREMMEMITATRAFEANTKLIQNQDHMIGTLISRVLQA